jgi:uncharacterized protein (DUF362 family)
MVPIPRSAGLILAGYNPLAVDAAAATIMGFDFRKIMIISQLMEPHRLPLFSQGDITLVSNDEYWRRLPARRADSLCFEAAPGWKGHIEKA